MKKNSFIKGAMLLSLAGILSKLLGFLYKVPIAELLGSEGYSLYLYPQWLFVFMIMLSTGGFAISISKLVSEKMSLNKPNEAYRVFKVALILLISLGTISSAILIMFSKTIVAFWPEEAIYSFLAVSIAPLIVAVMTAYRGFFQGLQIMSAVAISQIVEALGRMIIGVFLTYFLIAYGIPYAAGGASFGATIGAFLGLGILYILFIKYRNKYIDIDEYKEYVRLQDIEPTKDVMISILKISIPIAIGYVASTLMPLFDSFIVKPRLESIGFTEKQVGHLYSQLATSSSINALPITLATALAISLVPAISRARVKGDYNEVKRKIAYGFKIGIYIALPAAVGLYALAEQILSLTFPTLSGGGYLLKILNISLPFIMLSTLMTSMLQALNRVHVPVRNLIIGSVIKLMFSFYLISIPSINIKGPAIGTLIAQVTIFLLNYISLRSTISFKFDLKETLIKPLISSIILFILVTFSYKLLYSLFYSKAISTIISIIIGATAYGGLMIVIGAIDKNEIIKLVKRRRG